MFVVLVSTWCGLKFGRQSDEFALVTFSLSLKGWCTDILLLPALLASGTGPHYATEGEQKMEGKLLRRPEWWTVG